MVSLRTGSDTGEKGDTPPSVSSVPDSEQPSVSDAVALKRLIRKNDLLMMPGLGEYSFTCLALVRLF